MPKCDFIKSHFSTGVFRTSFSKNTSGGLLLNITFCNVYLEIYGKLR